MSADHGGNGFSYCCGDSPAEESSQPKGSTEKRNQRNVGGENFYREAEEEAEQEQPSGTIPYMAPEFLENKNVHFTEKTEVFSFGVLLWEIFSDPKLAREGPYPNL